MFTTVSLLITGALGMLGWFAAWRARGEVVTGQKAAQAAVAGEAAAKVMAFEGNAKAIAAEAKLLAEVARSSSLEKLLAQERQSKQTLLDEMAKRGLPVGDVVVDVELDRLYKDGNQGGQGPGSGPR